VAFGLVTVSCSDVYNFSLYSINIKPEIVIVVGFCERCKVEGDGGLEVYSGTTRTRLEVSGKRATRCVTRCARCRCRWRHDCFCDPPTSRLEIGPSVLEGWASYPLQKCQYKPTDFLVASRPGTLKIKCRTC
jgi:hypothetical protein